MISHLFAFDAQLGGFRERCDVRFNCACALVLAGKEDEARGLLLQLLGWGSTSASDMLADPDLQTVKDRPWFLQLVTGA